MTMRLVRRSARSVSWVDKETLAPIGKPWCQERQNPPPRPDSRIFRGYCGAKGSRDSGPFDIKPKAHAEEEEVPDDE